MADFKELKKQMKSLKEQAKKQARSFFQTAVDDLFANHPTLKGFSWSQYTPYFADGDECVFSANTDYINLYTGTPDAVDVDDEHGSEFESYQLYDWIDGKHVAKKKLTDRQKAGKAVIALLGEFDDDDFKDLFGDHVTVTVYRDKDIDVSEYSHD